MRLAPGNTVKLIDRTGQPLGTAVVQGWQGDWLLAKLTKEPGFGGVEKLFHEHEEAVNNQLFSMVDELESAIESLGLQLSCPDTSETYPVTRVQVMNEDDLCCQLQSSPVQG